MLQITAGVPVSDITIGLTLIFSCFALALSHFIWAISGNGGGGWCWRLYWNSHICVYMPAVCKPRGLILDNVFISSPVTAVYRILAVNWPRNCSTELFLSITANSLQGNEWNETDYSIQSSPFRFYTFYHITVDDSYVLPTTTTYPLFEKKSVYFANTVFPHFAGFTEPGFPTWFTTVSR